jgi:hypothetical protein
MSSGNRNLPTKWNPAFSQEEAKAKPEEAKRLVEVL